MDYQKIWDKVLSNNEEVQYEFSISSRYCAMWFFIWMVLGFFYWRFSGEFGSWMMINIFAVLYFLYYKRISRAYAFTNRRVVIYTGWLSTKVIFIDYNQIIDVKIEEPFWNRLLFKTGTFQITTSGTGSLPVKLNNIEKPYELKKKLDSFTKKKN